MPFKVDRVNLRSDDRWSRIVAQTNEQRIIWADNALKINRKDAKVHLTIIILYIENQPKCLLAKVG